MSDDFKQYIDKLKFEDDRLTMAQDERKKKEADGLKPFVELAQALREGGEIKRIIDRSDEDRPHLKLFPLASKDHVRIECFVWTYNHPKYKNNTTSIGALMADIMEVIGEKTFSYYYLNLSGSFYGGVSRTTAEAYEQGFNDVVKRIAKIRAANK